MNLISRVANTLFSCFVAVFSPAALSASAAVSPNWSAESPLPHQVTASHCAGGVANNMVVTGTGRLYVFYSETSSGSTQLKFTSTDDRGLT